MAVVLETTLGDITIDLYTKQRPKACLNFLKLCKIKYYNFNLFHTVNQGFIAQTGDPTGSGTGGESLWGVMESPLKRYFEAENTPRIKHTTTGLVSFVGDKDNMIGSQFFITLAPELMYLDAQHCVFGEVAEGFEILRQLNEAICDNDHRPYQDIRITHTVVLEDPFPDPEALKVPDASPEPTAERLQGGRIAPDEEIDETAGKSAVEVLEIIAEKEAKARATILEMIGDIPDAEMAPPENVLFVCKLNPVTNDDDLEIIFSRFGKIKSCEVIRDKKTGDSLQYAFVEFQDKKSCEDAYFKMDNVLIDDRRIHVDFSQSVAKVKWHGKGRGVTHYNDRGEKVDDTKNDVGNGRYRRQRDDKNSRGESENGNDDRRNFEREMKKEGKYRNDEPRKEHSYKEEKKDRRDYRDEEENADRERFRSKYREEGTNRDEKKAREGYRDRKEKRNTEVYRDREYYKDREENSRRKENRYREYRDNEETNYWEAKKGREERRYEEGYRGREENRYREAKRNREEYRGRQENRYGEAYRVREKNKLKEEYRNNYGSRENQYRNRRLEYSFRQKNSENGKHGNEKYLPQGRRNRDTYKKRSESQSRSSSDEERVAKRKKQRSRSREAEHSRQNIEYRKTSKRRSESGEEEENNRQKNKSKRKTKKDSSTDESSEEEYVKKQKTSKKKSRKRKETSSESDSESETDSEPKKKKKKKKSKKYKGSSSSDTD